MKQLIASTIDDVTKWYENRRFEREVFNASLSGVDHSFADRYADTTDQ